MNPKVIFLVCNEEIFTSFKSYDKLIKANEQE